MEVLKRSEGLGTSAMCERFGIRGIDEAEAYLKNETLRSRLLEITSTLLTRGGSRTAEDILGPVDATKVRSCMTLFYNAAFNNGMIRESEVFYSVIKQFYGGIFDQATLRMIGVLPDGNR